jgi:methyl-accepting chemotaxis protein
VSRASKAKLRLSVQPGFQAAPFDNAKPEHRENHMNKLSINLKLILLALLGLVFVSTVVVIETISNASIEKANSDNFATMEQANTDYREKTTAAQQHLDQIRDVLGSLQYARIAEKSYLQFYNPTYETQLDQHISQALDVLKKVQKNDTTKTLAATLEAYRQDFGKIVALHRQIEGLNETIIGEFKALKVLLSKTESQIIANRFQMQMQGDELSPAEAQFETMVAQAFRTVDFLASMRSQYLLTDNADYIDTLKKHVEEKLGGETAAFKQTAKSLNIPLYSETAQKYTDTIYAAYNQTLETRDIFVKLKETTGRLNEHGTVLTNTGKSFLKTIAEQMNAEQTASAAQLQKAKENRLASLAGVHKTVLWILVIALGSGAAISILLAIVIIRSITGPVNKIITGLQNSAHDVAAASNQMSTASHALAEGASEQAATIEETSSSLEEMSSMTKQNADNAGQANGLMQEANKVVSQANDSMAHLTGSMKEIAKASEEASKIIKKIDEIAFQTNLLALNAAVEAARAGEAGAGFAVVADEVRNLAMRATDAAKETANLIEGTVKKVNQGGELVTKTNEAFAKVAESTSKVGTLVGEISAASNEQAQGIEQINRAVVDMDKVIQQNAASAEQSASSSAEMSDQAEHMKRYVADLVLIAMGSRKDKKSPSVENTEAVRRTPQRRSEPVKPELSQTAKDIRQKELIPLEDGEFGDF